MYTYVDLPAPPLYYIMRLLIGNERYDNINTNVNSVQKFILKQFNMGILSVYIDD